MSENPDLPGDSNGVEGDGSGTSLPDFDPTIQRTADGVAWSGENDDGLLYFGPDNHARWCSTEHVGACIDEFIAKGERRAAERAANVRRMRRG